MAKSVLITGATSGLGSFLARHFAARGYWLFLHGRSEDKLLELHESLDCSSCHTLTADLCSMAEIETMFQKISSHTSAIDVLINNAFGKLEDALVDAAPSAIHEFFQVTLAGTCEVTRRSVPLLQAGDDPYIINIVADWGVPMHNIMTGPSLYIAAKYGMNGLGAALQTELAPLGIRTTNLCPGILAADTPFGTSMNSFRDEHGSNAIHPQDVASAIDFVLAAESAHVRTIVLSPRKPDYNGL